MDAIEKAIRNAFEKGNVEDRAFREKVYRSAFAALDRALQANPNLTVEAAINRRKGLQASIATIEAEFVSRVEQPSAEGGHGLDDVRPGRLPGEEAGVAPTISPGERGHGAAPRVETPSIERISPEPLLADDVAVEGERNEKRARRPFRIPFTRLFVAATIFATVAIGGWWALQTGILKTPAERDTRVPNPPQTVQDEDYIPENEAAPIRPGEADPNRDWIRVFSPSDASAVTAPTGTTAEVMEDASGSFLRIRSGESGSAILFDVGQGVLEQVAGKSATFDIVARAEEGKETEMSVDCNFGELGDCGRKRYAVGYEQGDYLFEVDFTDRQAGGGGTIAINSDFANEGNAVDIYEIRVSVSQ